MIRKLLFISILLVAVSAAASPKPAYVWILLTDGIEYATYSFAPGEKALTTIHAFRIDPKKHAIDVAVAKDEPAGTTAQELAEETGALIAINGGFFDKNHRSIGLIRTKGERLSPLHGTSWWSVFAIRNGVPEISAPRDFSRKGAEGVTTALQVGPRLAVGGQIPKLKAGVDARSAIGIAADGRIVLTMTTGFGITLDELARRMSANRFSGGFECPDAMALDGGSSSQLYAKIGRFELDLGGIARVTNGLVVLPKK